jgi:hypothetical protein
MWIRGIFVFYGKAARGLAGLHEGKKKSATCRKNPCRNLFILLLIATFACLNCRQAYRSRHKATVKLAVT